MNTWTLLINFTLKSTLIVALAWLTAFALRRRSAATRHIVWTAAFAGILALPLLSLSLPSWSNRWANGVLPADSGITFQATSTTRNSGGVAIPSGRPQRSTAPLPGAPVDSRSPLVWLWAAGVAFAMLQMFVAYIAVWRVRRSATPSPHDPAAFGISGVELLESEGMPMTAGILRPAIFLPAESGGWSPERVRIVVLHEFAHVVRGDAALQLLARTALCLQWFNPLAWVAWREFLKERERAADDLVLSAGARASDYAGHLLEIARTMQSRPASAAAAIAMARPSQLEGRLLAILDSGVRRGDYGRAALVIALLSALVFTVPLATVRAQSQAELQLPSDVNAVIANANAQKNHQILEQTAVNFEKLGKLAEAQKLREAALALRKQAGQAAYAEGLVRMGDLARRRNEADAIQYYKDAVALGDIPETVPALIQLGMYNLKRDPAAATDYLQRARNAARGGNDMGRAMTWLAFLQQNGGSNLDKAMTALGLQQPDPSRAKDAEALYRAALAVEDIGSSEQALTTEFLARLLRSQDRAGEADALDENAKAMRKALAAKLSPPYQAGATSTGALKVGNGVSAPSLLYKFEPSYSEEARAAKYQGTVLLKVVIDVDGTAKDAQVVRGLGMGLDEKAVEAVANWRFKPGEQGGVPVPVMAQIEINFRLL